MQLYLIDYESSQWCGGSSNVVVWAKDESDAEDKAVLHMEESMRELFSTEYEELLEEEGEGADEDQAYTINSIEVFDPSHKCWQFYMDPTQAEFFPLIREL